MSDESKYRVGRKLGRTIYHYDKLIGMMDTEGWASIVVAALNDYHSCPTCHGSRRKQICFRGIGSGRDSDFIDCPDCKPRPKLADEDPLGGF